MGCFRPLKGYRSRFVNEATGKTPIVFKVKDGDQSQPVDLPCGRCIGCRLERSRQWAIRCVHEASLYEKNCFITLTYRDSDLPSGGTLRMKDFQDFMKRLRKRHGEGIRFFHAGEYGEKFARPHYHACLFNFDFCDKQKFKMAGPNQLYVSDDLQDLWPFGFSTIGDVTFESAAYVARYITKKITGERAEAHYEGRSPEYTTMSRRPGIGKPWLEKFYSDVYPSDQVVLRGKVMRPPKYYDSYYEHEYPQDFESLRLRRRQSADKFKRKLQSMSYYDFERGRCHDRLALLEHLQELRFKKLLRGYESDSQSVCRV